MPTTRTGTASVTPTAVAEPSPAAANPISAATKTRLEAMQRHLTAARPASGNEALRVLRSAFPEASLEERVHAAGSLDRYRF